MVTQRGCSPDRQCWLRAWNRAKAEQLIPYRETRTTWAVKTYTVTITGTGWSDLACTCAAGRNGRICKHAAVVAKAIAAHVQPIRGTAKVGKEAASASPAPVAPALPSQPVGTFVSYHIPTALDQLFA